MTERIKEIRSGFRFEVRALKAEGIIEGYVAMFNKPVPSYKEKVMPGAFNKTLGISKGHLPVFYMHDPRIWVGMGLDAYPDEKGLYTVTKYNVDNSAMARENYTMAEMSLEVKNPAGYSIGFQTIAESFKGEWRLIEEVSLLEWSMTPPGFQAAPHAQITNTRTGLDNLLRQIHQLNEIEYEALLATVGAKDIARVTASRVDEPDMIHSINEALKDCLRKL